ncbi:MAG: M20 family metallopeptidase [Ferrimicrobium sp.]|jgi:amidohydrolase|uniref:Peptidase M20 domain-containing protein 2 n=1 Tax=Ferrimicrobium acidiphilum TaxID=121039 RepID=A0ABV3Y0K7_9ACTN|nr:M20 family metallopeptidase [Ferrimicrobium sp.]MCL5973561.1 M20 family metallopeptidase [Actinomycetota bacterium]
MPSLDTERKVIRSAAERNYGRAYDLSHRIHANPELGFEEVKASGWLAAELEAIGLTVTRGVGGLDTAVLAEVGSGDLVVTICAEYDALPLLGHACGHNVIAASAVLAAAALIELVGELGITLRVVGTPAEEGGGGKIILLNRGVFTGTNLAMMLHPAPMEADRMHVQAARHFSVSFRGRDSHAAAAPQLGINALDAMTIAQISIGLLRQHIGPNDRIHGIITKGGDAPNIIPSLVEGEFLTRAGTLEDLEQLVPRVDRCFEAGALATGSSCTISDRGPIYSQLVTDEELAAIYVNEATELGRTFPSEQEPLSASTDMGNLSLEVAVIHPLVTINSWPAVNHQPEFTQAAKSPEADRAMFEGGMALAMTAMVAAKTTATRDRLLARPCR